MKIIESGKYKGKILADCPKKYLEWAIKHENNFAERNRWISRDSRRILASKKTLVAFRPFLKEFDIQVLLPGSSSTIHEGIMAEDAAKSLLNEKYPNHQIMELNAFFSEYRSRMNASGFSSLDRASVWR